MLTTGQGIAISASVLAIGGLAALACRWPRLGGTTLVAPWGWSVVSLAAIWAAEVSSALGDSGEPQSWAMPLLFAAAMSTFCPIVALLGAKRPQNRGWQFIVLSLWVVLSLPSGEWLLFGGAQEMHPARFWFLVALIGMGLLNGIATRFWLSSVLFCLGQLLLCAPFFATTLDWLPAARGPLLGLAGIVAAWWLLAMKWPRASGTVTGLDRAWLDYRDKFGAVWSLRVMERMNASATMYDWPVMLGWHGFFVRASNAAIVEVPPAVEDSFRTLLRRFVSPEWIDRRLSQPSGTITAEIPARATSR